MRRVTVMVLAGFLVLVMISIIARMGTRDVLVRRFKVDNTVARAILFNLDDVFEEIKEPEKWEKIFFDAKKEYPFTKNKPSLVDTSAASVLVEGKRKEEFAPTTVGEFKKYISLFSKKRLLFYEPAIQLALTYEYYLGEYFDEKPVRVRSNYWVSQPHKASFSKFVASVDDFHKFLRTRNIPFLYVAVPNKLSRDSVYAIINQENIDKDSLLAGFKRKEIPFLDLRENVRTEGKDWHSLFYGADHHWRVETGFWASKIIAEKLNSDFGFDLDVSLLNPENYNHKVYKNWFLGSIGNRVPLLTKPDDFILITPKFETMFDVVKFAEHHNGFATKRENAVFESVFIYQNYLNKKSYHTYLSNMDGIECYLIHNKLNSNGKKIMIVGESNRLAVVPFLSVLTEYFVNIDVRTLGGSLETLVEKENPDIVIALYMGMDGGKLFDFR